MTLKALLNSIAEYGLSKRLIQFSAAGTSLEAINPHTVKSYPMLFTSPTGPNEVNTDTTTYRLTLYWLDRLNTDNSNDIDIFSISIESLKDLIIGLNDIEGIISVDEEYEIRNFTETERLNDRVAGAYTTIDIMVTNETLCTEE